MKLKNNFFIFVILIGQFYSLNVEANMEKFDAQKDLKEKLRKGYLPTTNIKGSLFFTLGAVDNSPIKESIHFSYENKIKLNTSFNGNDNLSIFIESGNAEDSPLNLDLQSKKGDNLKISTIFYQFKLNEELDAIIGPKMFGYNGLAGKSTSYNERIAILDGSNYTTSSGIGPGIGLSTKKNNGFNGSLKIGSNSSQINNDSIHFISQVGLNKGRFGGTITSNQNNEYYAYGVAGFYKPKNLPSISASIEYKNVDSTKTIKNWILALQKKSENKKLGVAVGTFNEKEKICYEAWSEIDISDKFKIIPVFFARENDLIDTELGFSINTKFIY
jgi:hypothetical protein